MREKKTLNKMKNIMANDCVCNTRKTQYLFCHTWLVNKQTFIHTRDMGAFEFAWNYNHFFFWFYLTFMSFSFSSFSVSMEWTSHQKYYNDSNMVNNRRHYVSVQLAIKLMQSSMAISKNKKRIKISFKLKWWFSWISFVVHCNTKFQTYFGN